MKDEETEIGITFSIPSVDSTYYILKFARLKKPCSSIRTTNSTCTFVQTARIGRMDLGYDLCCCALHWHSKFIHGIGIVLHSTAVSKLFQISVHRTVSISLHLQTLYQCYLQNSCRFRLKYSTSKIYNG